MSKLRLEELDPGVREIVCFFNDSGLTTHMSCEGHNDTNMSMFWVQFANSITEDDILNFQKRYVNSHGYFTSCGRFVLRVYIANGVVYKSWQYMAACKNAAFEDLRRWRENDIAWK